MHVTYHLLLRGYMNVSAFHFIGYYIVNAIHFIGYYIVKCENKPIISITLT